MNTPTLDPLMHASWKAAGLVCMLIIAANSFSAEFDACLNTLRKEAMMKGIAAQTFDTALTGFTPDQSVLEALGSQPEFITPIWDYMAGLVDEERVADGRAKLAEWASVFAAAEQQFGVDRHAIAAVWGVESNFGRNLGGRPVVRSLATVSCFGHRQRFFRGELLATLRILQAGDMPAEALVGSWAGAFGQTQFMPSTFARLAVDFDGDGRRDIVRSVPDALGSTANFLKRAGWVSGEPWGLEVRLPLGYNGPSGRRSRQPLAAWSQLGITSVDGAPLNGPSPGALLLPAGASGPAFIVFKNFDAIYSYNAAESYALAIAHLSDRLRGGGPLRTPWPTDDAGLSRAERREVQERLIALGFDIGVPDGILGTRTRKAIESFQIANGLTADGRAGALVLKALQQFHPRVAPASAAAAEIPTETPSQ
jgi:lytic murein transglycosylase